MFNFILYLIYGKIKENEILFGLIKNFSLALVINELF